MKETVLFIGDMNGNSQALAKRFVELGFKCEIIPFYEDYTNSNHFKYTKKQSNIISHTDVTVYNGYPILAYLKFWGFFIKTIIDLLCKLRQKPLQTPKRELRELISRTNLTIIGTGISPLLFKYLGRPLDIYYPSSQGVEFIGSPEGHENGRSGILRKSLSMILQREMINALEDVKLVVNPDVGLTHETLSNINLRNYSLSLIPFVEQINNENILPKRTDNPQQLIMFSRLHWVRPSHYHKEAWLKESKNNHLFITAFAKIIYDFKLKESVKLTIVEYGKDVEKTRGLVADLGIQRYVDFHSLVPKQDILKFLNNYDILVGEFYGHNVSIGGTGLEALQLQKPFINGGWLYPDITRRLAATPPIYFCNNETDIYKTLVELMIKNSDPLLTDRQLFFEYLNSNEIITSWLGILRRDYE